MNLRGINSALWVVKKKLESNIGVNEVFNEL